MKLHFFVIECINKSVVCHIKYIRYIDIYINQQSVSIIFVFYFVRVDE